MEKTVKVSWTDKNFSAYFADEQIGAVVATAKTLEELKRNFYEAFEFHIDGMREDGDSIPDWVSENDKEFEWQLDAAALIRACEPYTSLAAIARASGINEQQLSHYANGIKVPRPQQRQRIVAGLHKIGETFMQVK